MSTHGSGGKFSYHNLRHETQLPKIVIEQGLEAHPLCKIFIYENDSRGCAMSMLLCFFLAFAASILKHILVSSISGTGVQFS